MMAEGGESPLINPNAMPIDVAAKVLATADAGVTEAKLRADQGARAPLAFVCRLTYTIPWYRRRDRAFASDDFRAKPMDVPGGAFRPLLLATTFNAVGRRAFLERTTNG